MGKRKLCCCRKKKKEKCLDFLNITLPEAFVFPNGAVPSVVTFETACITGNLKAFLDPASGVFTVPETGIYLMTAYTNYQGGQSTDDFKATILFIEFARPSPWNCCSTQHIVFPGASSFAPLFPVLAFAQLHSAGGPLLLSAGDQVSIFVLSFSSIPVDPPPGIVFFQWNIVKLSCIPSSVLLSATCPPGSESFVTGASLLRT